MRKPRRINITIDFDDGTYWEVGRREIEEIGDVVNRTREFLGTLGEGGTVASTGQTFKQVFGD